MSILFVSSVVVVVIMIFVISMEVLDGINLAMEIVVLLGAESAVGDGDHGTANKTD